MDAEEIENIRWAEKVVNNWRGMGIRLNEGASPQAIEDIEEILNFKFPDSFRKLYQLANGFRDWDSTEQ